MKLSLYLLGCGVALLFAGCAGSGLETYDNTQRGPAGYAPNFTQHLNNPYEDPRRAPGGRY